MSRSQRSRTWRSPLGLILAMTLAVVLASIPLSDIPLLESVEGQTLAWRIQARGPQTPGGDVVILAIDDRSLDALGPWPVPRSALADAVDKLTAAGAAVIVFDLLFESGRPAAEGTVTLRNAVRRAGRVAMPIAFTFAERPAVPPAPPREPPEDAAVQIVHQPATRTVRFPMHPAGIVVAAPDLIADAAVGHVNVFLAADGALRSVHSVLRYGEAYFPALPVVAARLALSLAPTQMAVRLGEGFSLGAHFIETDDEMRLAINHYGPAGTIPTYALIDLLDQRLPPETFRGRTVFIGATALGVGDRFITPFTPTLPGVEVFATVTDNILNGRTLDRSVSVAGLDVLAILMAGFLTALLVRLERASWALLGGLVLLLAWAALSAAALGLYRVWLNATFPALVIGLGTMIAVVALSRRETIARGAAERQRDEAARYLSPLAGIQIAQGSTVGGYAAILFVDMRGFTGASEHMAPAATLALMRGFHRQIEQAIGQHGGVIDSFIGDGALAVFGGGQPSATEAGAALRAARALVDRIAVWNAERAAADEAGIEIGIGLHYGPIVIGEVGGDTRRHVSVAGDSVNVASRLEALTRAHGAVILASDALIEAARAQGASDALIGFVELPLQEIRGRRRPIGVWAWRRPTPSGAPGV